MITLGRTRTPFVANQTTRPDSSVGIGLGALAQGAGNVARATGAFADKLIAEQERENQKREAELKAHNTYLAHTALSEFAAEQENLFIDASSTISADGTGFTSTYMETFDKKANELINSLDPSVREEFASRVAEVRRKFYTTAYETEIGTRQNFYRTENNKAVNAALKDILDNPDNFEEARARAAEIIEDSMLPEAEKAALAETLATGSREAALDALAKRSAAGVGRPDGDINGGEVFWKQAPLVARRLLNTIASVEARGYNTLQGGGEFDDFSQHPALTGWKGPDSTAAGRYQFVLSTWLEVSKELGLTDFSPESQDRAAWHYARKRYSQATGRDLYADLMSGDPKIIAQARKVFAGTGSGKDAEGVVWEGLQHLSDEEFLNRFNAQIDIYNDPRLEGMRRGKISAAVAAAEADAAKSLADQKKLEIDNKKEAFNDILRRGEIGELPIVALEKLKLDDTLSFEQVRQLDAVIARRKKDGVTTVDAVAALADNTFEWNGEDPYHQEMLDQLVPQETLDAFAGGDGDAFMSRILPVIASTGVVPDRVYDTFKKMVTTNDPKAITNVFDALSLIRKDNPFAVEKTLDGDMAAMFAVYDFDRTIYTDQERYEQLRASRDKRTASAREALEKDADTWLRDNADKVDLQTIVDDIVGNTFTSTDVPLTTEGRNRLVADFRRVFKREYVQWQDGDAAKEAALARLRKVWGETTLGGGPRRLMRHPPEKTIKTHADDDLSWYEDAARQELKLPGGQDITGPLLFVPGDITEAQVSGKQFPGYQVYTLDAQGLPYLLTPPGELWIPENLGARMDAAVEHRQKTIQTNINTSVFFDDWDDTKLAYVRGEINEQELEARVRKAQKRSGVSDPFARDRINEAKLERERFERRTGAKVPTRYDIATQRMAEKYNIEQEPIRASGMYDEYQFDPTREAPQGLSEPGTATPLGEVETRDPDEPGLKPTRANTEQAAEAIANSLVLDKSDAAAEAASMAVVVLREAVLSERIAPNRVVSILQDITKDYGLSEEQLQKFIEYLNTGKY